MQNMQEIRTQEQSKKLVRRMDVQRMQRETKRKVDKAMKTILKVTIAIMATETIAFLTTPIWWWMVK